MVNQIVYDYLKNYGNIYKFEDLKNKILSSGYSQDDFNEAAKMLGLPKTDFAKTPTSQEPIKTGSEHKEIQKNEPEKNVSEKTIVQSVALPVTTPDKIDEIKKEISAVPVNPINPQQTQTPKQFTPLPITDAQRGANPLIIPQTKKRSSKLLILSGLSGIILLILFIGIFSSAMFYSRISSYIDENPGLIDLNKLDNRIIYCILFGIVLILMTIFQIGFIKIGKKIDSSFLKVSSWLVLILFLAVLFFGVLLLGGIFVEPVSDSVNIPSNIYLNLNYINFFDDHSLEFSILFLSSLVIFSLFFVSLIFANRKARFAPISGIFGLIFILGVVGLIGFLTFSSGEALNSLYTNKGVFITISILFALFYLMTLFFETLCIFSAKNLE